MAIFGTMTLIFNNSYTLLHKETHADVVMNTTCGAIFVVIVLVGLTLNPYLYLHYSRHETSWIGRYYRYLAVFHFLYVLVRGTSTTYYLLKSGDPRVYYSKDVTFLLKAPSMLSYLFGLSMCTTVGVVAIVQYSQLHRPLWSMVYGTQLRRTAFTTSVIFCLCWFGGFALLQMFLLGNCIWLDAVQAICRDPQSTTINLLSLLPLYLVVGVSFSLYLVTVVQFRNNPALFLTPRIRAEFRVVGLLALGNVLWLGLNLYNSYDTFKRERMRYEDLYVMFSTFTMVPCLVSAYNALVIFFSEPALRQTLPTSRGGYQNLN